MNSKEVRTFVEHQIHLFEQLSTLITQLQLQSSPPLGPLPRPLPMELSFVGNMEENFNVFVQSWKNYSKAIGMDSWPSECNGAKVSLLLAAIGEHGRTYIAPNKPESPEMALDNLSAQLFAKRNIVDMSAFWSARQHEKESINMYVARLKQLAKISNSGILETDLLTYKVVTTNKWEHLRSSMRKVHDITLKRAIDTCRAQEIAENTKYFTYDYIPCPFSDVDQLNFTSLYNWISDTVDSKHETPRNLIADVVAALMEFKTKPIDEAGTQKCVNLVFETAVLEPNCSEGCARLAKRLSLLYSQIQNRRGFQFNTALLRLCQEKFQKRWPARTNPGSKNDRSDEELKLNLDEDGQTTERNTVGTVRFIGELYNHGMLTLNIMKSVINALIAANDDAEYDEEALRCLCQLLTRIGFKMNASGQDLPDHFQKMSDIVRNMLDKDECSEIRIMMQEVIDLRKNGWKVQ